jgi:hypothetical protein
LFGHFYYTITERRYFNFVTKICRIYAECGVSQTPIILEDERESREYIKQAWAEAMELYRNGPHELKLSRETEEYLKEMQKEFMPEDAKVGVIQLWLDELLEEYVCSTMIYKEAFSHEYDTPKDWELKEINNVMNHSITGWEKVSSHRFAKYGTQRG